MMQSKPVNSRARLLFDCNQNHGGAVQLIGGLSK